MRTLLIDEITRLETTGAGGRVRAYVGTVVAGPIVAINEQDISPNLSSTEMIQLLNRTSVRSVSMLSEVHSMGEEEDDDEEDEGSKILISALRGDDLSVHSLRFIDVPDGVLGVSIQHYSQGLLVVAVTASNIALLTPGEIIVMVNGTSLSGLDSHTALEVFRSSANRKLVILMQSTSVFSLDSKEKEPAEEYFDEKGRFSEYVDTTNDIIRRDDYDALAEWKSIRSRFLYDQYYREEQRPATIAPASLLLRKAFKYGDAASMSKAIKESMRRL